jgi:hypothetical protein
MDRGKSLSGEARGAFLVGIEHHSGAPLGLFPPLIGAVGIGGDDCPPKRCSQLPDGLAPCSRQNFLLNCTGRVVSEHAGGLSDQPSSGQVNQSTGQCRTGRPQPPGQHYREVRPPGRAELGHRLRQRHLRGRLLADPSGTAVIEHTDLRVASRRSTGNLRDGRQLGSGRPGRDPAETRSDRGQVMIGQGRCRDGAQHGRKARAGDQPLGYAAGHLASPQNSSRPHRRQISLSAVRSLSR